MSGGGKGGKSKSPSPEKMMQMQLEMNQKMRPADVQLQTQGWGGMGYNMPQNPMQMGSAAAGQGLAPPSWATGDWAMPWWGQQAPNVGAAMMQQQNPAQYAQMAAPNQIAPQAPQAPQAPAPAPQRQPRRGLGKAGLRVGPGMWADEYRQPHFQAWMDNNG